MARTAGVRGEALARRPWTRAERRVVFAALLGRLLLAIEPLICALVFAGLTAGLILFPAPLGDEQRKHEFAEVIAPIFGIACVAFFAYAAGLLVRPLRALAQTFKPIFIVDGYVRYRSPDHYSDPGSNGYLAVLDDEKRSLGEWPSMGAIPLPDVLRPALVEFSERGGIARIDGRATGLVPDAPKRLHAFDENLSP
jgi:hypothetical protein